MTGKRTKKAVLIPDLHYPDYSVQAFKTLLRFIKSYKPDILIFQGDQLDMSVISHWNKDKKRPMELKRLKADYDGFDKDILNPIEKIIGDKCEKVWITGNHEDWVNQYIDKNPEVEGIIEPEVCLDLLKRGYKVIPLNKAYKMGKLNVIHGFYCNTYHAAKHVNAFASSVVYAHLHTAQEFTKTSPIDTMDYHTATSLPCMCNMHPPYMKDRPSTWLQGFGIAYVKPNGKFSLYRIIMVDNSFIYGGYEYTPEKRIKI